MDESWSPKGEAQLEIGWEIVREEIAACLAISLSSVHLGARGFLPQASRAALDKEEDRVRPPRQHTCIVVLGPAKLLDMDEELVHKVLLSTVSCVSR